MAGFFRLLVLILPLTATAWSNFGYPRAGSTGFGDFYGSDFGRSSDFHGYGNRYHDHYYDDYHGYRNRPCPRYRPMQVSDWQEAPDRQLTLDVSLPGVDHDNMDIRLSSDSSAIHVKGARAVPGQGLACLPQEARISGNRRYEILETAIRVPDIGNAEKASVRNVRGGVRISMPRRAQFQMPDTLPERTPYVDARNAQPSRVSSSTAHTKSQASVARNERKGVGSDRVEDGSRQTVKMEPPRTSPSAARVGSNVELPSKRALNAMRPRVSLPPSTGIRIENEEYPWPKKDPDACTGWVDNRGEFQSY